MDQNSSSPPSNPPLNAGNAAANLPMLGQPPFFVNTFVQITDPSLMSSALPSGQILLPKMPQTSPSGPESSANSSSFPIIQPPLLVPWSIIANPYAMAMQPMVFHDPSLQLKIANETQNSATYLGSLAPTSKSEVELATKSAKQHIDLARNTDDMDIDDVQSSDDEKESQTSKSNSSRIVIKRSASIQMPEVTTDDEFMDSSSMNSDPAPAKAKRITSISALQNSSKQPLMPTKPQIKKSSSTPARKRSNSLSSQSRKEFADSNDDDEDFFDSSANSHRRAKAKTSSTPRITNNPGGDDDKDDTDQSEDDGEAEGDDGNNNETSNFPASRSRPRRNSARKSYSSSMHGNEYGDDSLIDEDPRLLDEEDLEIDNSVQGTSGSASMSSSSNPFKPSKQRSTKRKKPSPSADNQESAEHSSSISDLKSKRKKTIWDEIEDETRHQQISILSNQSHPQHSQHHRPNSTLPVFGDHRSFHLASLTYHEEYNSNAPILEPISHIVSLNRVSFDSREMKVKFKLEESPSAPPSKSTSFSSFTKSISEINATLSKRNRRTAFPNAQFVYGYFASTPPSSNSTSPSLSSSMSYPTHYLIFDVPFLDSCFSPVKIVEHGIPEYLSTSKQAIHINPKATSASSSMSVNSNSNSNTNRQRQAKLPQAAVEDSAMAIEPSPVSIQSASSGTTHGKTNHSSPAATDVSSAAAHATNQKDSTRTQSSPDPIIDHSSHSSLNIINNPETLLLPGSNPSPTSASIQVNPSNASSSGHPPAESFNPSTPLRRRMNKSDESVVIKRSEVDGSPIMPIEFASVTLLSLGSIIHTNSHFHSRRYIFPAGYKSKRYYFSIKDPSSRCAYIQEILERPKAHPSYDQENTPLFRLTCEDLPDEVMEGPTASSVWAEVAERIRPFREQQLGKKVHSSISGPEQYGLSHPVIHTLIEELPNANLCKDYDKDAWLHDKEKRIQAAEHEKHQN